METIDYARGLERLGRAFVLMAEAAAVLSIVLARFTLQPAPHIRAREDLQ